MVAAVGVAVVGLLGWDFARRGPSPEHVERRVRAELPLGSTRPEVEAWLHRNSIPFAASQAGSESRSGGERVEVRAGLGNRPVGARIHALVDPAFVSLLWPGEVGIYFFFDPDGRLIGYAFSPRALTL